jgi:hypothetical protein
MKKVLGTLAIVFAASFVIGASSSNTPQAASNCYYTCTPCNGGRYCCKNNGVTSCKFSDKIQCTQAWYC